MCNPTLSFLYTTSFFFLLDSFPIFLFICMNDFTHISETARLDD